MPTGSPDFLCRGFAHGCLWGTERDLEVSEENSDSTSY